MITGGTIWKHVESGIHYVMVGECMLGKDWSVAVLYCRADGTSMRPIARSKEEFYDGRFVHVKVETLP